jgi:ribosomal subunit interface protein
MQIPLEVTFRNMRHSDAIEEAVRKRAEKLDRYHPRIMACRVMVEASHHRSTKGAVYHVRVDVTVPGGEFVAHREPPLQNFHEDVYIAIRDAFDRVRRELEDHARAQRGDTKTHEQMPHGRVTKLFPDRGYGFIETPDELEVYFHRNSVLDHGFDGLAVGTEVRFVEELGERGPQASTVIVSKKAGG